MKEHFERGAKLYDLKKWEPALQEFLAHLAQHPDDSQAYSLAAYCELKLKRYGDATKTAAEAIAADPTDAHAHYMMSIVMRERNALPQSFEALNEALSLEPREPQYLTALAHLHLQTANWSEALDASDDALSVAPEHLGAINSRATALIRLRRVDEAEQSLQDALLKAPEDEETRANMGWLELERGRWNDALKHFESALAIDPESEWARDGLMHAMRAKFPVYGLVLRWFLFLNKYSAAIQRQIMFAMFVGGRVIDYLLDKYPGLIVIVTPILALWRVFSYLTWTIRAATTLCLRCSSYGRMLVNKEELVESNIIGGFWLAAILTWCYHYFIDPFTLFGKIGPYVFWSLPMVTSIYFDCAEGVPKKIALGVGSALTAISLVGLVGMVLEFDWGFKMLYFYFTVLGPVLILSQFLVNKEPEKE